MLRPQTLLTGALLTLLTAAAPAAAADLPRDGWVVWVSNREDGQHDLYIKKVGSKDARRLTYKGAKFPVWSPDGRWIAYYTDSDYSTHVIRWDGSDDRVIAGGVVKFWMHDNSGVVVGKNDGSFHLVKPENKFSFELFKKSDFKQLADKDLRPYGITSDGRWLVASTDRYRVPYTGDNGTFKAPYWASVLLDLQDKARLYYIGYGCEPTPAPTGPLVYHVCGNCPNEPDIYKMDVKDYKTRASYSAEIDHPDADWGHEYFPRVSNDNKWLIFGASTGCQDHLLCDYEIFIHRLGGGNASRTRLTFNTANDQWPHLFIGDPARGIQAYGEEVGCGVGEVGAEWPLWLLVLLPLGLMVYRKVSTGRSCDPGARSDGSA